MNQKNKKILVVGFLDGWGVGDREEGNLLYEANTFNFDNFLREYPAMSLIATGSKVGLSEWEKSNAKSSYLNIGAGRVVEQGAQRIKKYLEDKKIFENKVFFDTFLQTKNKSGNLHLVGTLSSNDDNNTQKNFLEFSRYAEAQNIKVFLHLVLDGKSTAKNIALDLLTSLQDELHNFSNTKIASICGSFFAKDSTFHWDRTRVACELFTQSKGQVVPDFLLALQDFYDKKIYDEKIPPLLSKQQDVILKSEDLVLFLDHEGTSFRQLIKSLIFDNFYKFPRREKINSQVLTMTEYEKDLPIDFLFGKNIMHNTLGEVLNSEDKKIIKISSPDKYVFLTSYLNAGQEGIFSNEEDIMVAPKNDYSADSKFFSVENDIKNISKTVIKYIEKKEHDVILFNFSGLEKLLKYSKREEVLSACELIDKKLKKISEYVLAGQGTLVLLGTYPALEHDPEGINIEVNKNPIPMIIIDESLRGRSVLNFDPPGGDLSLTKPLGSLSDVATTLLGLLNIEKPTDMTGKDMLSNINN